MIRLYGKNQVVERLKAHPKTIKKIICNKSVDNRFIKKLAQQFNIPHVFLPDKEFMLIAKNVNNQGVIAETQDFLYSDLQNILQLPDEEPASWVAHHWAVGDDIAQVLGEGRLAGAEKARDPGAHALGRVARCVGDGLQDLHILAFDPVGGHVLSDLGVDSLLVLLVELDDLFDGL